MATMTMIQALNSALDTMMARDSRVLTFGEDVGYFGGVFKVTEHLQQKYGPKRCFDAPINECGIAGTAIGMAVYGLRPVIEIQFADYMYPAYDQLVSEAARIRYRSANDFTVPMTVRMPYGGGIYGGQTHSQSPEALFTHVAGLKTVIPATPYDAKGLLISAIEDDDPVIFLEPKRVYNGPFDGRRDRPVIPWSKHPASEVPEGYYKIPLGKANIVREGAEMTILAYGTMVHVALAATEDSGIDAEVIDLRTLRPLDTGTIIESVKKTNRIVTVEEGWGQSGVGAEIAARVTSEAFDYLDAPPTRVHQVDAPLAYAANLEALALPSVDKIVDAVKAVTYR